jgi:glycosyltransferase involved in cell wall biosynthesis
MEASNVTIVIPALNEEMAVGEVVQNLIARFPEAELIVVNDGSQDATGEVARRAGAAVIDHDRMKGYGAGLRSGVLAASRDYVLFCDADGQHSAEDVGRIIEAYDGHGMVVGARDRESHAPLIRRPGKALLRLFANFLAGEKIPDFNSGLRIVERKVLLRYLHLMPQGFSFSTTSTFALLKTNHPIKWIRITVSERKGASAVRQWKHGPQTLLLILRLAVLFEPLKVFLTVSGILFLLTLISLAIDLSVEGSQGIGDTTVLLSIATLIVFMFGLLCDQVSAIRRESHE